MISVVIVNWNSGRLLEGCVRSLFRYAAGCEIIIVDNASVDSSLRFAAEAGKDLFILYNKKNVGFAAGNNLGWRASKGDKILFLNPDTECLPESVSRLEQTLATDKTIWAAGGQLIHPGGKSQSRFNVRKFPSIGTVAAEMLFIDEIWPSNPWSGVNCPINRTLAADVDQPAAACLMVVRAGLEYIGGFDEEYRPAWFEDVDLCRRIRNQGFRIQYQPGARFLHHGGYSLEHLSRQDFLEIFHTNQIRYFKKHYGFKTAERVRHLVSLGLILRSALSLVRSLTPGISRAASAKIYWNAARHVLLLREAEL
jgi:N-acetylglucosaminyl-diphospho-decaprenol L-rhamnosyltransferase